MWAAAAGGGSAHRCHGRLGLDIQVQVGRFGTEEDVTNTYDPHPCTLRSLSSRLGRRALCSSWRQRQLLSWHQEGPLAGRSERPEAALNLI